MVAIWSPLLISVNGGGMVMRRPGEFARPDSPHAGLASIGHFSTAEWQILYVQFTLPLW